MDESIVMDEGRVKGDAIGIECDCGELKVQGIVVPLVIADLGVGKGGNPSVTSCSGNKALPHLLGGQGTGPHIPCSINRAYRSSSYGTVG